MKPEVPSQVNPLLRIRRLTIEGQIGTRWIPIVRGLDLEVGRGEILGLIGESGAGKSTVGLAAMGFVRDGCRFAGGTVEFDGHELTRASDEYRRSLRSTRIAYVAQSAAASFNPAFKLIDQYAEMPVRRGLMTRSQAIEDAKAMYRRLRLPEPDKIGFRYPHEVSGGQLQRAMTAMAVACRPDLIIFDEPTTAIDVTTQIEVLSAIRDMVRDLGTAAIYITHDLAVVAQMADRIKVLKDGVEVEDATTRQMLSNPKEEYTRSLWAVRNLRKEETLDIPNGTRPLLEVRNLVAGYGGFTVLRDISLDIHKGRTVAVVGKSGSGKSTAARVICGLLPPQAGRIEFNGTVLPPDLRQRRKAQLRSIQLIYQMADTALNPRQPIREIVGRPVEFYGSLSGRRRDDRVRELLREIDMDPDIYLDRFPSELSGGQKQRIGIARALAADPELIICDEVTSSLDQLVAEGILKLLARLQRERQLSYLFITHNLSTVTAIADDVVVMERGRIVEAGSVRQVFAQPCADYTRRLLSAVPEMDPDWLTRLLGARDGAPAHLQLNPGRRNLPGAST